MSGESPSPAATFVGVDVGMNRDPSAIAVAEVEWRHPGADRETHFQVRYLEATTSGIRYPEIARRTAATCAGIRQRGRTIWSVFVNVTGSGTPLLDLLREKLPSEKLIGVYFNHGDRRVETDGGVNLGKALLVSRLQLLLQTDRLHLPQTAEAKLLWHELHDFQHVMEEKANDRNGAFRVGTRDELLTAIGLAAQVDHPTGSSLWDVAGAWGSVEDLLR